MRLKREANLKSPIVSNNEAAMMRSEFFFSFRHALLIREAIVRTGTDQKLVWESNVNARAGHSQRKKARRAYSSFGTKTQHFVVCCFRYVFLYSSFFSYLIVSYPILDKICGSKNWGGPIYRKLKDGRPPSRRRHSQISIYKNIHMSNLLIRLRFLFFFSLFSV